MSAPAYERRGNDWRESRLPLFDSAFTIVTDSAAMEYESSSDGGITGIGGGSTGAGTSRYTKEGQVNESAIRAGFLNFFVSVLKTYRRCVCVCVCVCLCMCVCVECMCVSVCVYV